MDVLIHISLQLSNFTTPAFEPAAFQVSSNIAVVNMLFFLSLALVLIDAFLAMLVKGWLLEFDRGWRKHTVAHLRAQERERRRQELESWKLHDLVALLPILIQLSLLLFSIGILVLIFPLHLPSAIVCLLAFVAVVRFYAFTTGVSIVSIYAPFSSLVSRLLVRGFAISHMLIASAISFHSRPPLPTPGHQGGTGAPDETMPSYSGVAERAQSHNPDSVEKSNMVPRSHSALDPQNHVHVLERLVTTTVEAGENIPIFLELFDQPVKYPTLQPSNVQKWKELLRITLGLPRDQSSFSVSAACTLARTMMICYNHETPDTQLFLTLQHHLGSKEADDQRSRRPLNVLFSSYLPYWLGYSDSGDLWRTIAFLKPSDAADAELLWMVNTFHQTMRFTGDSAVGYETDVDDRLNTYLGFFAAVLTYVSSTEQSRRSKVPLTAAVIYALYTIRSAIDRGGIDLIECLHILPRNVSTSEPALMAFCQVSGIDTLDLWRKDCVQFVKAILQWDWRPYFLNDFRLSLIAALYIDSGTSKQAHARSTFEGLFKHTPIEDTKLQFSGAYDDGNLAIYSYMALAQKPLPWDPDHAIFRVIVETISKYSTLQLSGLQILEIALKHVDKRAGLSSNWLEAGPYELTITLPDGRSLSAFPQIDHWILLHLGTIFPQSSYLPPEDVKMLEWSDTPEKVHIASARLDLYDSWAKAEHEGAKVPKPDPRLLRVFLRSNDYGVCTRAFDWCLDLVPISQSGPRGKANSTKMFIPENMGYKWVVHFIHVLCESEYWGRAASWECLISRLDPKWAMLPSYWCHEFASALLFTVVKPVNTCDIHGLPAYQLLAESHKFMPLDQRQAFLPFLATRLKLVESSLTRDSIISLENWLAQLPKSLEKQKAHTRMERILATKKRPYENIGFLTELPMAGEWLDETLELFAELPMAGEWLDENLDFLTELPMAGEWLDETLELFAQFPMAGEWMNE